MTETPEALESPEIEYIPRNATPSDEYVNVTQRINWTDSVGTRGSVFNIEHRGDGSGHPTSQTYGADIHNNPGARSALVIHQYSNSQAAIQLDNTDDAPMILVKNTSNETRNPAGAPNGTSATGDAFKLVNTVGANLFRVLGRGEVVVSMPEDATGHGIDVSTPTAGTRRGLYVRHNSQAPGLEVTSSPSAAGQYPFNINGQDHGGRISTMQNGGTTFQVSKNGTGNGNAVSILNSGTGQTAQFRSATMVQSAVISTGEFEHFIAGAGVILKSPNGTRFRLSVTDGGSLSVAHA